MRHAATVELLASLLREEYLQCLRVGARKKLIFFAKFSDQNLEKSSIFAESFRGLTQAARKTRIIIL